MHFHIDKDLVIIDSRVSGAMEKQAKYIPSMETVSEWRPMKILL